MLMLFVVSAVMTIIIGLMLSSLEKNSIVINSRDGPSREYDLSFVVPRLNLLSFSQFQSQYIGKRETISKKLKMKMRSFFQHPKPITYVEKNTMIIAKKVVDVMTRCKHEIRNGLKVRRCFLKKAIDDVESFFKTRYSYVCSRC